MNCFRLLNACCFLTLLGCFPAAAIAQEESRWMLQTSLYTLHFNPEPYHNNNQKLINLEYQRADRWLGGIAIFENSYYQSAQYLYIGKLWQPFESAQLLHVKLSGGLLLGYKDEYESKIPVNHNGVGLGIVPAIGLSGRHVYGEISLLGNSGAMLTLGILF